MESIRPTDPIIPGKNYTTEELIKRMVVYSDNNATQLLYNKIDHQALKDVFADLGIDYQEDKILDDYISPKQYSLFFRALFNATYLNPEMSEKALSLLAQVDFTDGIASGIPSSIPIAHKFGERHTFYVLENNLNLTQLHDCGIVFYKNNPYFLCVMTKGLDVSKQKKFIASISHITYTELEKIH